MALLDVDTRVAYDRTGPGTPAGDYLRRYWMPVAELNDVKPGRAKAIKILSERYTYYRGASGEPHLIGHFCAHRNIALSTGRVEGEQLRCFYHGWRYDAGGQCTDQPCEDASFKAKVSVGGYPAREYLGLVYAYLGPGEPPPFHEFASFTRPGTIFTWSYVRRTNYFNSLENSADWLHANFVHAVSGFTSLGVNREIPELRVEETDYGLAGYLQYTDGKEGVNYILMPIAGYIMVALPGIDKLVDHLAYRVPIDDYSHRTFIVNLAELEGEELERFRDHRAKQRAYLEKAEPHDAVVDAVIRGDIHIDDVDPERPDLVGVQDSVVMETQPPISERPADRLGRSDLGVILLRRIFEREVSAARDGRPLKQWVYPDDLRAIPGI
jgi:5,5'-dehydrodivanillate O-demethylase